MNDWMCARSAAMRSAARACCMARSVRMRTNSSKPPGVTAMLAAVEEGDRLHRAVQQARGRARPAAPRRESARASVSSHSVASRSRWLVGSSSSSRSGCGEQRGGQRHAHAPAAGEFLDRARLRGLVEAQAGEDGGGARGCGIGADRAQAFVDLGEPVRIGACRLPRAAQGVRGRLAARCRAGRRRPRALPARRWRCGRGRRGGCRRRPAAVRRRWRAAGWTCRRRCGRPGRCGGPGRR